MRSIVQKPSGDGQDSLLAPPDLEGTQGLEEELRTH